MSRTPPGPAHRHAARVISVVAGAALMVGALAACTPAPDAAPSATTPVTSAPTASPAPTAPALVADGSAADNLPLFTQVMEQVAAGEQRVEGRAYIDGLVAAGFDKAAMEVTADRTTVDDPVDSIQFSVLWAGECLVGQVGPSTPAPTAVVMPELPSGGCLVGVTRDIDW